MLTIFIIITVLSARQMKEFERLQANIEEHKRAITESNIRLKAWYNMESDKAFKNGV